MKYLLFVIVFFVGLVEVFSQDLNITQDEIKVLNILDVDKKSTKVPSYAIGSSTISLSGTSHSITTPNGTYYVSQSIGQASVIGIGQKGNYTVLQGFQQYTKSLNIIANIENELKATIYPNPFEQSINIFFDDVIKENINIRVFDVTGKVVFSKGYPPSQLLNIPINYISSGIYIINIISENKKFGANIIKK